MATLSKSASKNEVLDTASVTDAALSYTSVSLTTAQNGEISDGGGTSSFDVDNIGTVSINNGVYGVIDADLTSSGGIGAVNISTKASSDTSSILTANQGNITSITMTATGPGTVSDISAYADGSIGAISISTNGASGDNDFSAYASAAIGAVTLRNRSVDGDFSAYLETDSGNIGNIVANNFGGSANFDLDTTISGDIGLVSLANTGTNSELYAGLNAYGNSVVSGSIAGITANFAGVSAYTDISAYADENIGNIAVTVTGNSASANVSAYANSGNIGNITYNKAGMGGSTYFSAFAEGNIGNVAINLTKAVDNYTDIRLEAEETMGTVTFTSNGNSGDIYFSAYANSGNMGNVLVSNVGTSSYVSADVYAGNDTSGSLGNVTVSNIGDSGEVDLYVQSSGNIGNIVLTSDGYDTGFDADIYAYNPSAGPASGSIGSVTMTNGNDSGYFSAYIYAEKGVGAITLNNTGYSASADVSVSAGAIDSGGGIGNIILNQNAFSGTTSAYIESSGGGNVGTITLSTTGDFSDFSATVYAYSGGNIGNVTLTHGDSYSADSSAYIDADEGSVGNVVLRNLSVSGSANINVEAGIGNIGTITISTNADDAFVSAGFSAFGSGHPTGVAGNIGAISLTFAGEGNEAKFSATTSAGEVGGGNIGNIVVTQTGGSASAYIDLQTDGGGDIGNITWTQNSEFEASAFIYASAYGSAGLPANIGNVTMTMLNAEGQGNNFEFSGYTDSGNIGNVTAVLTGFSAGFTTDLTANETAAGLNGKIGNITVTDNGFEGSTYVSAYADTSIGNVNIRVAGGYGIADINLESEVIGSTTVTFSSENVSGSAGIYFETGATATIGAVKVVGGSELSSAYIQTSAGGSIDADSIGSIDLSLFLGSAYIDVSNVTEGTTINLSQAGTEVYATEGDDTITGYAGDDTIYGEEGEDIITAAGGDDEIWGGIDADRMTGGLGENTFGFNNGDDEAYTALDAGDETITFDDGIDIITDFKGGDLLDLPIAVGTMTSTTFDFGQADLGIDDDGEYASVRGSWNATTKVFTKAASGADKLVAYDADGADTADNDADLQIVLLLGAGSQTIDANDIAA